MAPSRSTTSGPSSRGRGMRSNRTPRSRSGNRSVKARPTPTRDFARSSAERTPGRALASGRMTTSLTGESARTSHAVASPGSHIQRPPNREVAGGDDQNQFYDDASLQEVIMALDMKEKSIIGCAYFTTESNTLFLSDDVPMADMDLVQQFLIHAQPTTLLISARAPEHLINYVEKQAGYVGSESLPDLPDRFILRRLQSSEFSLKSARDRLVNLHADSSAPAAAIFTANNNDGVGGPSGQESQTFRSMRCGGSIGLDSEVSVTCAGAILGDLHRRRSAGFLPDGQAAEIIFHIGNIIQTEIHPNSQAWGPDITGSGSKESLSVYGLFHHLACTPQGRSQLRRIFLRPVLDLELIRERQGTIAVLLQPDNADRLKHATSILRKIRNLRSTIAHLRKGIEFPSTFQSFEKGVWATIRQFTAKALELRELVSSMSGGGGLKIVHKLLSCLHVVELVTVGEMIHNTLDFEQSKSRRRPSVKTGVDHHLDDLKRRYDGMESFLTEVVNQMNKTLPEWACQYIRSCIFLPQLGFLTVVEPHPETGNGRYEGEGTPGHAWEKLFTADGAVCYKNGYMRELDEEYGDMYCQIGDREVEIIHGLASRIIEHQEALIQASDVCGEFDSMLALALGAEKYGWRAPCVNDGSLTDIQGGRHPLQELVVPAFVPNDCCVAASHPASHQGNDGESNRHPQVVVLTGPNHSGKSIFLKQTAIIVYLAHIGSFVPADRATIGLTDKILTRISTKECMMGAESAFAIDLKQVALSTKCSTPRSLVLVDEFGKGTNADDGAGLLAALLDHFLSLGPSTPRILVASHFHEIFEGDYLGQYDGLRLAHMDVRVDWETTQLENQVTYLFKLTYGHSTSSFGSRCAAMSGVPNAVVERAEAIALLLSKNEDLGTICTRLSQAEEMRLEEAETTARRFLRELFEPTEEVTRYAEQVLSIKQRLQDLLSSSP